MREITSHIVEGDDRDNQLKITVLDQPGAGGANHVYGIGGMDLIRNSAAMNTPDDRPEGEMSILFQCGGIPDHGVNGITHEALLAIIADRLECFQAGPFACQENATALQNVNEALRALHKRTQKRIVRGVEGKSVA